MEMPMPPQAKKTDTPDLEEVTPCDICSLPMLDIHCKLLCLSCGYQRDCSDP